ncbi:MAG TPA: ankyrin repeat domain-containing protein, partial [Beijerinckiaceae bacterium]|nr:ankyrin repeat domain-containing protein [Beijerinckiaceae bacterium]
MEHVIGPPPVIAIQPVGRGRTQGAGHVDVIYILGPDSKQIERDLIEKACAATGLSLKLVGDGVKCITESDIQDLRRQGVLGPDTHIFVSGHGSTASGYHSILNENDNEAAGVSTADLVKTLLADSDDSESAGSHPPASGMIHVLACEAGFLKTEFTPKNETWPKRSWLVHANTNSNSAGTILPNAIAVIELLGDCRERGLGIPDPHHVLAKVLTVTGECVTLMGGTLTKAETYHAPKSQEDVALQNAVALALQEHLENEILARQGRAGEFKDQSGLSLTKKLQNAFLVRVLRGDIETVRTFLSPTTSFAHTTGIDGLNALIIASADNHFEIVDDLLHHGAKVDAADSNGSTALHHASKGDNAAAAERLLRAGASVNALNDANETPLLMACAFGNFELAKLFLDWRADPNIANVEGLTPLIAASAENNPNLVELLLQCNADGAAVDNDGNTALHQACERDHFEVVRIVLNDARINAELKNKAGLTPLRLAIHHRSEDAIAILIERGVSLDDPDENGRTPLHDVCARGQDSLAKRLLWSGRVNINAQTANGETPLSLACASGRANFVTGMIGAGAAVNLSDKQGRTPLIRAALSENFETVQALIEGGAGLDLDAQDEDGWTALTHACYAGAPEMVSALLGAGASANVMTLDGKTASRLVDIQLDRDLGDHALANFE